MRFLATCKLGLESLVTRELHDLDIQVEETQDARIFFSGDYETMMRVLLWLRTAERVLLVVGMFPADSFDALFEGTRALDWKEYLRPDSTIHVNGKSAKSGLFSVSDCQRIVKKAIVENLKSAYRRPDIPEGGAEMIVEIGMLREEATLALDCCGAGLSRRGYRTYNVAAPLSETLGAAVVMLSRFRGDTALIDPMCGSGTMPIEAAMIAANIAPGHGRSFAAERWPFLEKSIWQRQRDAAAASATPADNEIFGYDIDPRCIELSKIHAKKAGVRLYWNAQPLSKLKTELRGGIFVCNPPYGERLLDEEAASFLYRQMRAVFSAYPDWSVNVISGMRGFEHAYGKRADKRRKLSNGGLSCQLYQYFRVKQL